MSTWPTPFDEALIEHLFDTNGSPREFAESYDCSLADVSHRIKELGLGWVNTRAPKVSRGQGSLMKMLQKLLPGEKIVTEEPIGERLRLDVYCPTYKLAVEYHGRQHFEFVEHFHQNLEGFRQSQRRDERKIQICKDLGIALVVFRYNDDMSEEVVFQRLLDAIRSTPSVSPPPKKALKGDHYYESWKNRQRQFRRESYKRMRGIH